MSTNTSSASTVTSWPQLLNQDQYAKLSVAFKFAIIPCLSAVGICGNVLSMFLLARLGFRKSSNVLLFGLALADVLYLTGINNFAKHVLVENVPVGYTYSESVNYLFYIFYMLMLSAHYFGLFSSVLITVLITVDRLLVVFLPLKVHTIVTSLRTLLVISCIGTLIIGCFIYQYVLCFRFEQVHIVGGVVLGSIVITDRLYQDAKSGVYLLFVDTLNYMTGIVPVVFVTLGCAVIGLKVTLIIRRRRELTSGGSASTNKPSSHYVISKTTRTLVFICILYIMCNSFEFIFIYILRIPALHKERNLLNVLDLFNTFSQCVNSAGNFIIYVASNNNFNHKNLRKGFFYKKQALMMSVECVVC